MATELILKLKSERTINIRPDSFGFDLIVVVVVLLFIFFLFFFSNFSHQLHLNVFHCSLSDSKSLQISRTLPSIAADLDSTVVWIVSIFPLIFSSSGRFSRFSQVLGKCSNHCYHNHLHVRRVTNSLARSRFVQRFIYFHFHFQFVVFWYSKVD